MNPAVLFQIYECQNPQCRLRFPTNFSIQQFSKCPLCGSQVEQSGKPFSNAKFKPNTDGKSLNKISVLLDNLRSTLNVGSIFRSANCTSIEHIYCCGTTPTPAHSKFGKSGLNAEQTVPWSYHHNALDVISENKKNGFEVTSLELATGSASIFEQNQKNFPNNHLLVVGNELSGVDPAILDLSDSIVYIPMLGSKDSLNVAIAAAIAFYVYRFSLKIMD